MEVMKFNYTRDEAAFSLGVSVRTVDHLIHRGDLETKRIGKKVLIPREVLRRYAAGDHPEATNINEPSWADRKAKRSRISEATQG